jgi:hypothetical protein
MIGIGAIIKPTDAQGTGMVGTDSPATPVGGGTGGATIGRDVADRQRFAAVLGDGFWDGHGRRLGLVWAGRQGRRRIGGAALRSAGWWRPVPAANKRRTKSPAHLYPCCTQT